MATETSIADLLIRSPDSDTQPKPTTTTNQSN